MNDIPSRLCGCGCGETTPLAPRTVGKRGIRKGDPLEYIHGHNRRKSGSEYLIDPQTGCWIWQRAIAYARNGYGISYDSARKVPRDAHRVMWEREHGPLPAGCHLHHLCGTPPCVNPAHLEVLSPSDHMKVTARTRGKLTMDIAREIRASSKRGIELAAYYGVSTSTISFVRTGKIWRE